MTEKRPFIERGCQIGGCLCPAWDAWSEAVMVIALNHPGRPARTAEMTYDEYMDRIVEFAKELSAGGFGDSPIVEIDVSLCGHPDACRWAIAGAPVYSIASGRDDERRG